MARRMVTSVRPCTWPCTGYGVFTTTDVPEHTRLCIIPCDIILDPGQNGDLSVNYISVPGREGVVAKPESAKPLCPNLGDRLGQWINHTSCELSANAGITEYEFVGDGKIIYFVSSLKNIPEDTQVLMDYGPDGLALEEVDSPLPPLPPSSRTNKYTHTTDDASQGN